MIVFDTETTSLTAPEAAPLIQQPFMLEFAAIKLDDKTLKEKARLTFLVNPRVPIPPESTKITGITNEMVNKEPPFPFHLPKLQDFYLGERIMAAHNLPFDTLVLKYELERVGKVTAFPWPFVQICTVEKTFSLHGHRLNLAKLHLELTGKEHKDGAHRAMVDVEALVRCIIILHKRGLLGL